MAYLRPPTTIKAGRALQQNPPPTPLDPAGILQVSLDAEIATTDSLGVVQVGSGLSITPEGILSADDAGPGPTGPTGPQGAVGPTGPAGSGGSCQMIVIEGDYVVTDLDYYIGVIANKDLTITLPSLEGEDCRLLVIKKQQGVKKIFVRPAPGDALEGSTGDYVLQQPLEGIAIIGRAYDWWVISKVQQ